MIEEKSQAGDTIKVKSFNNQYGKIIEVMEGSYRVLIGTLKLVVKQEDIIKLQQPKAKFWITDEESGYKIESKKYSVKNFKIDLHGFTQEQAIMKVKESLEEAKHYKAYQIEFIHGKGTGALRIAIHSLLKTYQSKNKIKKYEFASGHMGGHGVTVVYL